MGRFDVLSTVVIAGPRWRDAAGRAMAAVAERPVERRADLLVAAAPLKDAGCLLRIAGRSVEQVSARDPRLSLFHFDAVERRSLGAEMVNRCI